jgi:hypothetical protein
MALGFRVDRDMHARSTDGIVAVMAVFTLPEREWISRSARARPQGREGVG